MEQVDIGQQVPNIELPLLNGDGTTGFRDYAGRRLVVFAWASW